MDGVEITLHGIPVELDPSAPTDRIVMSPAVLAQIESAILEAAAIPRRGDS